MLFLSDFNKLVFFLDRFWKKQIFFMKILLVGDKLFNVDRQTDMTKLLVVSLYFTNAYKKDSESKRRDRQRGKWAN